MEDKKTEVVAPINNTKRGQGRIFAYQVGKVYALNQDDIEKVSGGGSGNFCWSTYDQQSGTFQLDCRKI